MTEKRSVRLAVIIIRVWVLSQTMEARNPQMVHFGSISTLGKKYEEQNGCCNLNYKLGVQIMAGLLTIFSAVFLVLHHLKVKEMIDAKFERMFKQEPRPEWNLTVSNPFYFL